MDSPETFCTFPRREIHLTPQLNDQQTIGATAKRRAWRRLGGGLWIFVVYRLTCHFFAMIQPSAWISPNHGMPGKTTPSRSDGPDISALQIPPNVEEIDPPL
ncbi:MAG: hypothetical protein DMG15_24295 [Acidobacteria bacterium]|nr:MAG: hypothetical protein DMG16_11165 [Acidobacteriota bacterium]PYS09284.1 MAG: hypothetical protein DMG15_24295 [Acidobacteriota bacterium]